MMASANKSTGSGTTTDPGKAMQHTIDAFALVQNTTILIDKTFPFRPTSYSR